MAYGAMASDGWPAGDRRRRVPLVHMIYRARHASGLVNHELHGSDSQHVDDPALVLLDGVGHLQRRHRAAACTWLIAMTTAGRRARVTGSVD
jgi:hypothetical protein